MGLLHAAIDAALQLRPAVSVNEIDRIDIDMPEAAYGHGGWKAERPIQTIGAQMNVSYAVAVALLDGDVLIDQFTKKRINSDDVWNLIDRTQTHHESAYDQLPVDDRLTTQVRITLKDGSTHAATVGTPTGQRQECAHQLRDSREVPQAHPPAVSPDRQAAIEKAVLNLDTLSDVGQLTALLTPTVHSPLD